MHSVKNGLLIVGNFNKHKYDRTSWYTLTDKGLEYYSVLRKIMNRKADNPGGNSCGDFAAGVGQIPTPIPKPLHSSSNNTITTSESIDSAVVAKEVNREKPSSSAPAKLMKELIEVYREEFPNNPQPHKKAISTSLEKTLLTLIKRWPEADPDGLAITVDGFRRYMIGLKTLTPKFALSEYVTKDGNKKKNDYT